MPPVRAPETHQIYEISDIEANNVIKRKSRLFEFCVMLLIYEPTSDTHTRDNIFHSFC